MWIMSKCGFFSVVEHRQDRDLVIVRARVRKHLERLSEHNPVVTLQIQETPDADYRFRSLVKKDDWAELAFWMAGDVDYPNFKAAACEDMAGYEKPAYAKFLNHVWHAGMEMQEMAGEYRSSKK